MQTYVAIVAAALLHAGKGMAVPGRLAAARGRVAGSPPHTQGEAAVAGQAEQVAGGGQAGQAAGGGGCLAVHAGRGRGGAGPRARDRVRGPHGGGAGDHAAAPDDEDRRSSVSHGGSSPEKKKRG